MRVTHYSNERIANVSCTWVSFRNEETCIHSTSIISNVGSKMRIESLRINCVSTNHAFYAEDTWEVFDCEKGKGEDYQSWMVFCRSKLSSKLVSSTCVILDNRACAQHKQNRCCIVCTNCVGVVGNRMLCAHETEFLSVLESETQVRYASREYSANNGIDENFKAEAISYDRGIHEKKSFLPPHGHCFTEREVVRYSISFVSTRKVFFLCESDKKRFGSSYCTRWMQLFLSGKIHQ